MKYIATVAIFGAAGVVFSLLTPGTNVLQWVTMMLVGQCLQVLMSMKDSK